MCGIDIKCEGDDIKVSSITSERCEGSARVVRVEQASRDGDSFRTKKWQKSEDVKACTCVEFDINLCGAPTKVALEKVCTEIDAKRLGIVYIDYLKYDATMVDVLIDSGVFNTPKLYLTTGVDDVKIGAALRNVEELIVEGEVDELFSSLFAAENKLKHVVMNKCYTTRVPDFVSYPHFTCEEIWFGEMMTVAHVESLVKLLETPGNCVKRLLLTNIMLKTWKNGMAFGGDSPMPLLESALRNPNSKVRRVHCRRQNYTF